MKFIADFHIHSHFSIATSRNLIPEQLDFWAHKKGIQIIGTGDFAHPGWTKELSAKLEPAEQGLFKLKDKFKLNPRSNTRFILTAEISNIYKKFGKVRKVHNLLFAPDFQTVEKIQIKLSNIGNITSDGRPILGLDSRDLLEIVLESSEDAFLVPAHIWTPWFSALGSKSGFDTIAECYGDLTENIFAVETGLSSDPPMNWICSFLDKYTLISNSDAHSPEKLGREANMFATEFSYNGIKKAMKEGNPKNFLGTIEFFPQEGKYHFDGHRKCGVRLNPLETLENKGICPKCGKKVTVGVMNRVAQLADRKYPTQRKNRLPFLSIITLKNIISQIVGVGPNSKTVGKIYESILNKFASEFDLLLNIPIPEIEKKHNEILAEGIRRMRNKEVKISEGFDGEFGQITVFSPNELSAFSKQKTLFSEDTKSQIFSPSKIPLLNFDIKKFQEQRKKLEELNLFDNDIKSKNQKIQTDILRPLNQIQKRAVKYGEGPLIIIAGPGTGKTRVLTQRIEYLILNKKNDPQNILAITFTNKAAEEMAERLRKNIGKSEIRKMTISTFHSFGLSVLKKYGGYFNRKENFSIFSEREKRIILKEKLNIPQNKLKEISKKITEFKQNAKISSDLMDKGFIKIINKYEQTIQFYNSFDLDDLIYKVIILFKENQDTLEQYQSKYQWVFVDEYQDINYAQYLLIKFLMPDEKSNVCVIGDPNQAIYGFRGANVNFIHQFEKEFPTAKSFFLKKSYRCSNKILKASNQVLSKNAFHQSAIDGLNAGVKLSVLENFTEKGEAEQIARTIENMMGGLRFFSMDSGITTGANDSEICSLSDFVVLGRLNRQLDSIEKAFHDHSIPYNRFGIKPFFQKEPNKSVIDLLKVSLNPKNLLLTDQLIKSRKITIGELLQLKLIFEEKSVADILERIIITYFKNEKIKNADCFDKLLELATPFKNNIEEFVKYISIGREIDRYDKTVENVSLMTLHAAKGLEFKCVFIIGCEDGLLPYSIMENQKADTEEERRLFYVGMTRAQKYLFLTFAHKRFLFGKQYTLPKSPFLSNIEKSLLDLTKSSYKKKKKKDDLQETLF
ncbi:MAG: UvrD-helicase domain-containing protein [Candidatus Cloacimonadota bacterium]|nr:UvrD-helicase domain-containing protein [Candidatus Cloacimonadota bacterium]